MDQSGHGQRAELPRIGHAVPVSRCFPAAITTLPAKCGSVLESNSFTPSELALWINGQQVSHLGKGFPKGKWVFDTFNPGQGGEGVRWNDQKGAPEHFSGPAGGEPFEGFHWRNDARLNLNYLWLLLYITDAAPGQVSRVWFDDVVVATQYIGPIQPK